MGSPKYGNEITEDQMIMDTLKKMMDWYDEAKNPKGQELVKTYKRVIDDTPNLTGDVTEAFAQGMLFGYFVATVIEPPLQVG